MYYPGVKRKPFGPRDWYTIKPLKPEKWACYLDPNFRVDSDGNPITLPGPHDRLVRSQMMPFGPIRKSSVTGEYVPVNGLARSTGEQPQGGGDFGTRSFGGPDIPEDPFTDRPTTQPTVRNAYQEDHENHFSGNFRPRTSRSDHFRQQEPRSDDVSGFRRVPFNHPVRVELDRIRRYRTRAALQGDTKALRDAQIWNNLNSFDRATYEAEMKRFAEAEHKFLQWIEKLESGFHLELVGMDNEMLLQCRTFDRNETHRAWQNNTGSNYRSHGQMHGAPRIYPRVEYNGQGASTRNEDNDGVILPSIENDDDDDDDDDDDGALNEIRRQRKKNNVTPGVGRLKPSVPSYANATKHLPALLINAPAYDNNDGFVGVNRAQKPIEVIDLTGEPNSNSDSKTPSFGKRARPSKHEEKRSSAGTRREASAGPSKNKKRIHDYFQASAKQKRGFKKQKLAAPDTPNAPSMKVEKDPDVAVKIESGAEETVVNNADEALSTPPDGVIIKQEQQD